MRAGLSIRLQQNEVISVDQFFVVDVAEDGFDLAAWPAQDALGLGCAVVHQSPRDLAAAGVETADYFAPLEDAFAAQDADWQQALAALQQGPRCTRVEDEAAGQLHVVCQPLLARAEAQGL